MYFGTLFELEMYCKVYVYGILEILIGELVNVEDQRCFSWNIWLNKLSRLNFNQN